jgi:glyoxylase-like metal-dependent hydrolase (beta-lactamase superfamily II)
MTFKHGPWEITPVVPGTVSLDGGSLFGVVPRTLWERTYPPDERNRVLLATRVLLARGNGRVVLVDCGVGDKGSPIFREIYRVEHLYAAGAPDPAGGDGPAAPAGPPLLAALAAHGVRAEDVTDVILTHLHFDHCGGATRKIGPSAVPTFPKALHHVQEEQIRWARRPTEKDRASFIAADFEPLAEAGRLVCHEGPAEIAPGADVIVVNGHTPGMQIARFHDGAGGTVAHAADLWGTSAHLPLPYIMANDLHPLTTLEEKRRLSAQALDEGWTLCFPHDPRIELARIEDAGGVLRARPLTA